MRAHGWANTHHLQHGVQGRAATGNGGKIPVTVGNGFGPSSEHYLTHF